MIGMSLFANVGIAEAYLEEIGIEIKLANEIDSKRVKFYKELYPQTEVVEGDITSLEVFNELKQKALNLKVDFLMATPPCQGMSNAGKKDKNDIRNQLIVYAIEMIKEIKPKYVFLENVPQQLKTKIKHNNEEMLIPDYIKKELEEYYNFNKETLINSLNYGVAQSRERAIFLMSRKDQKVIWEFPEKDEKIVTLEDAIGNLPSLDPLVNDIPYARQLELFPKYEEKKQKGLSISKWHNPPEHVLRQVFAMMHTPTGRSAFENMEKYKPLKKCGAPVKGFKNTYKRQYWDKPGYTITMYNRTISSQDNVHPGREVGVNDEGIKIYSDPRVLTVYELMRVMSLPDNWGIPLWASEHFVRQVIGEGIPPLLVKKIFLNLVKKNS